jgi:hypothetical protein
MPCFLVIYVVQNLTTDPGAGILQHSCIGTGECGAFRAFTDIALCGALRHREALSSVEPLRHL